MSNKNILEFDAAILQECAIRLYRKAGNVVALWVLFGIILGIAAGLFISLTYRSNIHMTGITTGGLALFIGLIGYSIGSDRAFKFRLEAQHVLCQVAIERNTRLMGRVEPQVQAQASKPTIEERVPQPAPNAHGVFIG